MKKSLLVLSIAALASTGCGNQDPIITSYPFSCAGTDYSLGGLMGQKQATIYFDGETLSFSVETNSGNFEQEFKLSTTTEGLLSDRGSNYVTESTLKRYGDRFVTYTKTVNPDGSGNSIGLPEAQDFTIDLKDCSIRPAS